MFNKSINVLLENKPAYRYNQVLREIYFKLTEDWDLATSLPLSLRKELKENFNLEINGRIIDSGNTDCLKAVIGFEDKIFVESVLLKHESGRNTVCVSSQAGCVMDCLFCTTASNGFIRNLSSYEILAQILFFLRILNKENKRITNVVFMGMGEALINYDNMMEAVRILNNKDYFNIGQRKISISSSGVPEKVRKLADEGLQLNLALSINAPNDKIRKSIMPRASRYSLDDVLDSARYYFEKTGRRIMFEYVLLKDINDKEEHALELADKIQDIESFVNLIPFNGKGFYSKPQNKTINAFKKTLIRKKINVTQRYEFGTDIKAACGQLISKFL
ncbi:MAG: 23S rRNA (adenine(2503)-C(2))-methyltransferase RlmN [Actinomycetota bacterium]|nr:23S rRNA (adenine(2503)-C(2))-methyltransferase RlmN [Actinomycetota bacterium]